MAKEVKQMTAKQLVAMAKRNGKTITVQKACEWKFGAKGYDWSMVNGLGMWTSPAIKDGQSKTLAMISDELEYAGVI